MYRDKHSPQKAAIRKFIFLAVCLNVLFSAAQSPDDQFQVYSFNRRFLEHRIKEGIDSVRVAHGLTRLYNDSILYVAAAYHAGYLFKRGELSHDEPEFPDRKTPQLRAEYFGARNYGVGENIAYTYAGMPVKNKKGTTHVSTTYRQVANDLVIGWVNSPGHFRNMLTPEYNATGLAVYADPETGRIYAVQKFATILYKYTFNENKDFFSYSGFVDESSKVNSFDSTNMRRHKGRHAHKLREPKKARTCAQCSTDSLSMGLSHIEYRHNQVYFVSYSPAEVLGILRKKKDGLAAELVPYNPYDCGNPLYYTQPSRRNGQCVFSGVVLKPLYRKKAMRGFNSGSDEKKILKRIQDGKTRKYEINLGKIPDKLKHVYFETNLVLIQKKRVCRVVHFSGYCGDTLERFFDTRHRCDLKFLFAELADVPRLVQFTVPFQKAKTDYSLADIKPLTDSLLSEVFTADSIAVHAFASVEGDSLLNEKIARERAQKIAGAIAANQKERLAVHITAKENWELFAQQIEKNKALAGLKNKTPAQLEELLHDSLWLKKTEPFLAEQRRAQITLRAREHISDAGLEKYLKNRIKAFATDLAKQSNDSAWRKQRRREVADSLQLLMRVTGYKIQQGKVSPLVFNVFQHMPGQAFKTLSHFRVECRMALFADSLPHSEFWRNALYQDLLTLHNEHNTSFFVDYNLMHLVQTYGKQMGVYIPQSEWEGHMTTLLNLVRDSVQMELVQKLILNGSFKCCRLPLEASPPELLPWHSKNMERIIAYFNGRELSMQERNRLAAYYVYHSYGDLAAALLLPDLKNGRTNVEGFKLLAKMFYLNSQEYPQNGYFDFLQELAVKMGNNDWCSMFVGPCNVSFQAFDSEDIRKLYCSKCASYLNYVKQPKEE